MFLPRIRLLPDPRHDGFATLPPQVGSAQSLGVMLLRDGALSSDDLVQALTLANRGGGRLSDILLAQGLVTETALFAALARQLGAARITPLHDTPDPRLIDRLGATICLRNGLLPWRAIGGATIILTAQPDDFAQHRDGLTSLFGPVIMALAPASEIEASVLALRGAALDRVACTLVAEAESCRTWGQIALPWWVFASAFGVVLALIWSPVWVFLAVAGWSVLTLALATAMKLAAAISALRAPAAETPPPIIARMPVVSVMVPLFREANIAARLIRRLERLEYPRDLLDIVLVVEEEDQTTRIALRKAALPSWMRVIVVPDGRLKTKPRALNHALGLCRGAIIGIYDAEDAPAPDQIARVVDRFHRRGGDVACLQGVLDFYNPRTNWLSRCFTIEYATWFRIILPGLPRMGLAIPLGGTTLFFRRAALERLGGWDAHNVTEDADLGFRLARHGYRTELIDSVTEEEANCRVLPWIRQRSRWLKGYMITYAVHMRDPKLLLRQLGWWKFAGFQVFFLTTLSQFLLAPVLLTFWAVPLGLPHPMMQVLTPALSVVLMGVFLLTEAVQLAIGILALRLTPNRMAWPWVAMLHLYFPLGALASYKAAWELVGNPFYWDKTSHGHHDPRVSLRKPRAAAPTVEPLRRAG